MVTVKDISLSCERVGGAIPVWRASVNAGEWRRCCETVHSQGAGLVAMWGSDERDRGSGFHAHAALSLSDGLICLDIPLSADAPAYPRVDDIFPAARRMQRALYDMLGIQAEGHDDGRPWLRHAAWPPGVFPLRKDFDLRLNSPDTENIYPFVRVAGEGVHEIPVGPVHAGIIEPGHFRFSIVGEHVLRLEQRLGYKHKAIEKLFETMTLEGGARLAGRVSGDSTVAYAWAYSMAVEGVTATAPPPRSAWLRALLLERERIANHLGDLGALGNDAGFAFGLSQFLRLKEELLRVNDSIFGHRYLMDVVVPGGVSRDIPVQSIDRLVNEANSLEASVRLLRNIYDEHPGVQDRFVKAGIVTPELAGKLGMTGLVARASGQARDARLQMPCAPYDQLPVKIAVHHDGDVAARVAVRFDEVLESLRLIRLILRDLPAGDFRTPPQPAPDRGFGVGLVEGWRGEVLVALHAGKADSLQRVHAHDPSWQNWPLLEHAIIENIVPDFPLINKSFNMSYSGHDL